MGLGFGNTGTNSTLENKFLQILGGNWVQRLQSLGDPNAEISSNNSRAIYGTSLT